MKKRGILRNWGYLLKNIAETDKLLFCLCTDCNTHALPASFFTEGCNRGFTK